MNNRIKDNISKQAVIISVVLMVFVCLNILVYQYAQLEKKNEKNQLQESVLHQASDLRASIEHEINTTLNLTLGALIYVSANPEINQQEFSLLAQRIIQNAPYIRNIGLAKNNIISHVYPVQGNEKALGLRYLDNPQQRDAVLKAMKTRETLIAGPVNLVQGGQGFISRIPIFLDDQENSYWGMTSIVVDVTKFLKKVGITEAKNIFQIAIRGKDAKGDNGEVFFGNPQMFENNNNVRVSIKLPQGYWSMIAAPKNGWELDSGLSQWIMILGFIIVSIVSLLLYGLLTSNTALTYAKQRAELANEHKSRFFTNMTHELRTPLTAIHGVIRLVNKGSKLLNEEESGKLLDSAERNCNRLIWIVNDILDLKKLESGKMEYHKCLQPVYPIIEESISDVQPYATDYGVTIELDSSLPENFSLTIDNMRLQQVLVNLLSNAIKYSPESEKVNVRTTQTPSHWRLEVIDHGNGVPVDKLETIFTEFEQANGSTKNIVASTGLGLSISRHIVQDHGGNIGCFNNEDRGVTFYVEIPL